MTQENISPEAKDQAATDTVQFNRAKFAGVICAVIGILIGFFASQYFQPGHMKDLPMAYYLIGVIFQFGEAVRQDAHYLIIGFTAVGGIAGYLIGLAMGNAPRD